MRSTTISRAAPTLEHAVPASFPNIPVKTPEGVAEIGHRVHKLGQRHRTVLLLVDGRRSEAEVRHIAARAGAPDELFDELVAKGLIARGAVPGAASARLPEVTVDSERLANAHDLDFGVAERAAPAGLELDSTSGPLPPSLSLLPDLNSSFDSLPGPWSASAGPLSPAELEGLLRQARRLLVQALRSEAPVAGSLTMLRLSRARTREDIEGLLDEVEARIAKPGREVWAVHVLDEVRELLRSHAVQFVQMPVA